MSGTASAGTAGLGARGTVLPIPHEPAEASSRWWADPRAGLLAAVGLALVASGLVHVVVWAFRGGPWEGPVAWRKPILFGVSGGATAASLGWAWSKLPVRHGDAWLAAAAAWALAVEVALIDLQCWRGVASHFNRATAFDSLLYDAMGVLILFVTLVIADLTLRFLRQPVAVAPDMLLAARAGLALLTVSCLIGIWASVHGDLRSAAGSPPELVGAAGVTKFPHGVALHAIQSLPALAWAARRAGINAARRTRLVAWAAVGTGLALGYALLQTTAGRGRFDAPPAHAAILVIGVGCQAVPVLLVAIAATRSWGSRAGGSGASRRSPRGDA